MADYYTPTVVQQVIPFIDITPLECLLLGQIFQSDTVESGLYFTSEDGPNDMIWVERESLRTCLDDPAAKGSAAHAEILHQCSEALKGDDDVEIDASMEWWTAVFQDIVRRSSTLDHISVIMSYTCSKLRADGLGGMAMLITAQAVRSKSTEDILAEFINEAEASGEIKPLA
jgi:hypothetical protein